MITRATVAHVPVEASDGWRWWEPVRLHAGPRWFYGEGGVVRRPASHPDPATVDGPLRPLVALLRRAGLPTLPSCAGHFSDRAGLRATYRALQRDAAWISGHGLTVRCSETGRLSVLRVPEWRLPPVRAWAAPVLAANGRGRIGIVVPAPWAHRWAAVLASSAPGVRVVVRRREGSTVLDVQTRTTTPASRDATWRAVTAAITRLLRQPR